MKVATASAENPITYKNKIEKINIAMSFFLKKKNID
jgi:hypothetical protein